MMQTMGSKPPDETFDVLLAEAHLHLDHFRRLVEAGDFAALERVYQDLERVATALNRRSGIPTTAELDSLESFNDELGALIRHLRSIGREPDGTLH
jgi:hypothetical protein